MYGSHPQALNKVKFSFPFPSALHTEDGSINQHTHILNSGWMSNKRQLTERITSRSAKAVKTCTAMWIFQSKFPILPLPIIPCTQMVYLTENLWANSRTSGEVQPLYLDLLARGPSKSTTPPCPQEDQKTSREFDPNASKTAKENTQLFFDLVFTLVSQQVTPLHHPAPYMASQVSRAELPRGCHLA